MSSLIAELHQSRVQDNGQQQVAAGNRRHWQDGHEVLHTPIERDDAPKSGAEHNHHDDAQEAESNAVFERLENSWYLLPESCFVYLLCRTAPGHVVAKHVGEQGRRHVEAESTKEDGEHQCPFKVLRNCKTNTVSALKRFLGLES